jgi:3-oxoacyl-[acyl-carrier protein] reductase
MNKLFHEMTVLITGASGAIGGAIARRFATLGMNIVINYLHSHEAANETARACRQSGSQTLTVSADVSVAAEVGKMADKLAKLGLFPDILVNNAGQAHNGLLTDITEAEWDRLFAVNVKGTFLCSQRFLPHMIQQKFGRIINVSSIWGLSGASCEVAYSATKGAVNAFTKALAKELAPSGITVNAVAPGPVDSVMLGHLEEAESRQLKADIPAGRFATADEVASLVYFLALHESGYINGQIISPNGAWLT